MAEKKEDIRLLKKQVNWLSRQLANYDYALKAGAVADEYLLRQNAVLLKLADNIMLSWKTFQSDIDEMNKNFSKKK